MSEFSPSIDMGRIEAKFTVGKVEKTVEQKIETTAKKIIKDKILEKNAFDSEIERNFKANEVIEDLGFSSYIDMVDTMTNSNATTLQKEKANGAFDVLVKSVSLAMNFGGNQDLQTGLNLGEEFVTEVEPYSWQYVNMGNTETVLAQRVREKTITNEKLLEKVRRLDKLRSRINLSDKNEVESLTRIMENSVLEILEMNVPSKDEMELFTVKAYISTEIAVLRRMFKSEDSSVDKSDEDVMIGRGKRRDQTSNKFRNKDEDYPDIILNKKGEKDDDSREEGYTRSWEIDPNHMAEALKFMGDLRWSDWTPPAWFKDLEKTNKEEAYRISVMAMINQAASGVAYAGKNLDKIIGYDPIFAFTHEHMSKLFDEDFKLVVSKMLNDLCELAPDQNGRQCLRYKEGWEKKKDGEGEIWTIKEEVFNKIRHIKRYEDEMAEFLAEKNGRAGKPNYMDKMNAYTAWNMFYGFGDSSMADRMRILPTYNNVINDALRTLNPEYKALAKWQILKSGNYKEDKDLFDSEYFSGPLADYVLTIMKIERDLGHEEKIDGKRVWISKPIDGKKTLRKKILDGEMPLLANKTFYGFFDFVHGGRDLFKGDFITAKKELEKGVKPKKFYDKSADSKDEVTLASLMMDYGEYRGKNFVKKETAREFNFGNDQVTFMNEFRDMLEGAILVYNCTMGKTEVKDPATWARTLKDKLGMVNGIEINGTRALSYTSDPEMWRDAIIGSFGADMERLSSEHIRLIEEIPKGSTSAVAYNLYVNSFLTNVLRLSNNDVNLNEVMRKLGVSLKEGESPEGVGVSIRNKAEWIKEKIRSENIINRQSDSYDRDLTRRSGDIKFIIDRFKEIDEGSLNNQTTLIYKNLGRAIKSNNVEVIKRLWGEMEGKLK